MLSFSKTLQNNLSHAFTPNIRDVIKFYSPGDQSLETDFSAYAQEIGSKLVRLVFQMFERRQNI